MLYKKVKILNFEKIQTQLVIKTQELFNNNKRDGMLISHTELEILCPDLTDWLYTNNLQFDVARFLVTPSFSSTGIHVDGVLPDYPKFVALNLPILTCNNSHMVWWNNVQVINEIQFNEYGGKIRIFDSPDKEVLEKLELSSPHFVRIDVPHNVDNTKNSAPRIILSLRFKPEPLHLFNFP
jgi:hypothetical protein